jgi:hypothetical protein
LAVEVDLWTTTTTHLDDDSPSNQWFCIYRRSAPIAKPTPCSYVADVEDHQEESGFFQPNAVYLSQRIHFILKPLLHNDKLFNLHRKVYKETMLEVITSNNDKALGSSNILQTLGVESVAKQEVSSVFDRLPLTRCNGHKFNQIISNWRALQMKQLQNEHYLPRTFISDVQRSKIEFKFVIKQLKM